MALTVIQRPELGQIDFTTEKTASVSDDSGDALFTSTSHGLVDGAAVYIKSTRSGYNGFWIADRITGNTFKIREYATADHEPYFASGNVSFYIGINDDICKWNAVHLPIVYKLQSDKWPTNSVDTARTVSSFSNSNGYTRVLLSGDIKASGSADALEQVQISGTASLDGIYKILSWASDINFVIDLSYSATNSFSGGTIQYYYGNYHARVRVYAGLPASHYWADYKPYELIAELSQAPDSAGVVTININEYLKKKINILDNNLLLDTLPNNVDAFCYFYISVAESYDDANQYGTNDLNVSEYVGPYTDDSELVAVNAKLPFKTVQSGNMGQFILNRSVTTNNTKWLTGFTEPTLWPGKYFDVSFIKAYKNTELAGGFEITIARENYLSGVLQSSSTIVVTEMHAGVYRIPVEQSASLEDEIRLTIDQSYGTSETLVINVDSDCSPQDFYVTWLNNLGGFDYWNFKAESVFGIDVLERKTQEKNIFTNWPKSYGQFADSIMKQTQRRSVDIITLNSQYLSQDEMDGLSYIASSALVQRLTSIYDRRTIIVDTGNFPKEQDNQKLLMASIKARYTDEKPAQSL